MASSIHRSGCTLLGMAIVASSLVGCDAFEYYGPLPNLRHALTVNLRDIGRLEALEIKRKTLSSDAAKEIRLVNTVNRVAVEDCQIADGRLLLESLGEITRLESLTLRRCNLSDGDLAGLAGALNLRELEIIGTDIDGVGLAALSKLSLRSLTLHSKTARAETLACLGEFESLEELSLNTPNLTINELPNLSKLKNLRSVSVLGGEFSQTDETALAFLKGVPYLREIFLSSDSINDSTMHALGQISTLRTIELSRNSITDQGIAELNGLGRLTTLRIWAAEKLTAACLQDLLKHQELSEISLCGAPIHHSEAKLLDVLPKMTDRDIGMSRWDIAEARGEHDAEDYVDGDSNEDDSNEDYEDEDGDAYYDEYYGA